MTPRRRLQIWAGCLVVSATGLGLGAVTVHQMLGGLIRVGRRYNRVEISLDEAPILFWSFGLSVLLFCLALVMLALWLTWHALRRERKPDGFLSRREELGQSVRKVLERRPRP